LVAYNSETIAASPPPNRTDLVLEIPNLSEIPAIYVSIIDIKEVSPAKISEAKNKNPNTSLNAGNSLIIAGKTTNANPTPPLTTSAIGTPCCVAIKPNTENTPIPASNSKLELLKPVIKALFVMSDFFGK